MGRPAKVHYTSLRTCLCNLPLAIHGPLAQRAIVSPTPSFVIEAAQLITPPLRLQPQAPQSVVVELTFRPPAPPSDSADDSPAKAEPVKVYLGWSGFPSQVGSVSVGRSGASSGLSEVVEVDPQVGAVMGLGHEGSQVSHDRGQ